MIGNLGVLCENQFDTEILWGMDDLSRIIL